MEEMKLAKLTKGILDFMFYSGIIVCVTLPLTLKLEGKYMEDFFNFYYPLMVLFL